MRRNAKRRRPAPHVSGTRRADPPNLPVHSLTVDPLETRRELPDLVERVAVQLPVAHRLRDLRRLVAAIHHQRRRAAIAAIVNAGKATCARCHEPIDVGQKWHLDHNATREGYLELRPQLLARGPLAAAYLELLAAASRLSVAWDIKAMGPSVRRLPPARCQWCGQTFAARRHDARFCSDRCRWAATKAASRLRKRESEVET